MLSLAIVTLLAVFLVERIEDVVEAGIPDQFLGLILLPLVEKAAEHLTAIDEAWDGQMVIMLAPSIATCAYSASELRAFPLYWPLHPDRTIQCSPGGHRWMDLG